MRTSEHPRDLTDAEAEAVVATFDSGEEFVVATGDALAELRAASRQQRCVRTARVRRGV